MVRNPPFRGDLPPQWQRATPRRARTPKGQCRAPTPAHPRPQHLGTGRRLPAPWMGSRGRTSALPQTPLTRREASPPRGCPPASSTARNAGSQERTLWGWCLVPGPTPAAPGKYGQRDLAACPKDGWPAEGERLMAGVPDNGERYPRGGRPPAKPAARNTRQGTHAKGTVQGPHSRTAVARAHGQRIPTARLKDRQPGEDERRTSDTPQYSASHPPPETPSRQPHSAQGRPATMGLVLGPNTHTTQSSLNTGNRGWPPFPRMGGRERESA